MPLAHAQPTLMREAMDMLHGTLTQLQRQQGALVFV
jgi:hypothetical protein